MEGISVALCILNKKTAHKDEITIIFLIVFVLFVFIFDFDLCFKEINMKDNVDLKISKISFWIFRWMISVK